MASGHPIQVKPPLFTIPSTLKKIFSTSAIRPSHKCNSSATRARFEVDPKSIAKRFDEYLKMVKNRWVEFYINTRFFIVSNIETAGEPMNKKNQPSFLNLLNFKK